MLPFIRRRGIPPVQNLNTPEQMSSSENRTDGSEPGAEPFYPTINDVLKARYILRWKIRPEGLPMEIVDMVIDAAEYWPSMEVSMKKPVTRTDKGEELAQKIVVQQDQDRELVRSLPLCFDEESLGSSPPKPLAHRTAHPCRKIVFSILAHDQGWGGGAHPNKYHGSFTWFDTEVIHKAHETPAPADGEPTERSFGPDDPLLLPTGHRLQCNCRAERSPQHYIIIWHHLDSIEADSPEAEEIEQSQGRGRATLDGRVVRELQVGDSISVWGRARFGGWANHVEQLSVRVFWAV